ncbi:O-antigen ligase [Biostraticola tofi]|uniref:O-antigen ligase n=2 Tax=Biostraticola tofi TaxID=466109 RepID=A0A4R3YMG8_9GAMM|nr:O-antigen ligase [Biostraticola tofi]
MICWSNSSRLSGIDKLIPLIYMFFSSISIAFFLYSGEVSRNAFYILTYISIIYFCYWVFKIDKKMHLYLLPTLVFLLGASKLVWLLLTSSPEFPLVAHHYQISGKRMVLGYFVLYCIQRNLSQWRISFKAASIASYILFVLLIMISVTNAVLYLKTGERVKVNSDAATSGAYMFVLFSMLTIYCLRRFTPKLYRPLCLAALILSVINLLATETRSALLFYGLFIIFCLVHDLFYGKKAHKKLFAAIILTTVAFALFLAKPYYNPALERMDAIQQEVTLYTQGQNNSSVGARLSLWKSAWYSFKHHPLGQSVDSRNALATRYIVQHENSNQEALNNIQFHTHNDLLDTLSLQGIFGGIIMLAFFIALLLWPFKMFPGSQAFLLLSLPVVFFSQGDCQFYNRESPYLMILVLGFLMMLRLVDVPKSRAETLPD